VIHLWLRFFISDDDVRINKCGLFFVSIRVELNNDSKHYYKLLVFEKFIYLHYFDI